MTTNGVSPIGLNIARYRKAEGLSASELSDKVGEGLTRSVIANLENGRKEDVTVKQLIALAVTLRVPPVALVVDYFDPGSPAPYEMPDSSWTGLDLETMTRRTIPGRKRNRDFEAWFTGANTLLPSNQEAGAPQMFEQAQNAMQGYNFAWRRFYNAVSRYVQADYDPDDSGYDALEHEDHDKEIAARASEVLLWIRALHSAGVKNEKASAIVHGVLNHLKITLPAEIESGFDG